MKVKAVLASAKPKNISRTEPKFCRIPPSGMLPPHQCAQGGLDWVPSAHPTTLGTPWRQLQKEAGRIIFKVNVLFFWG